MLTNYICFVLKIGGWPKDVDANEVEQVMRYRKKIEKDENFLAIFRSLTVVSLNCNQLHAFFFA